MVIAQVLGAVNRAQPDDVPEELRAEFEWLTDGDATMARSLLKRVTDEVTHRRLQVLTDEIRKVFRASVAAVGRVRSRHEITVPGVILTLDLQCGSTAQGAVMSSDDRRPNDLVPTEKLNSRSSYRSGRQRISSNRP